MKINSKLTLIGSMAVLAASPIALAGKGAPSKADAPEVSEAEPEVIVCDKAPAEGEVVDGDSGANEEQPGKDVVTDDSEGGVDPAVCEAADGEGVPIDWVKRGGDGEVDPDVIFQNTAGEAPVFKGETASIGKELGQDEKASDIEPQDGPVIQQVKREKKVPVALIKKGRVFLR